MLSIDVPALCKFKAHLQQLAANKLFVRVVMALSLSSGCIMTSASTAETAVVPHNGRIPAGFHHHLPPFVQECRGARSCDPVVTFKRFKRWEPTKPRCAVSGVDGDDGAVVHDRALKNVIITGANRGLGFAIADHMLDIGGYRVVLACRSQRQVCRQAVFLRSAGVFILRSPECWNALLDYAHRCIETQYERISAQRISSAKIGHAPFLP